MFGQRLETQTALVLCDDCVYFFTFHMRAMVSVQGNKVDSGAHQSVKVGRATVWLLQGFVTPSRVWTVVFIWH